MSNEIENIETYEDMIPAFLNDINRCNNITEIHLVFLNQMGKYLSIIESTIFEPYNELFNENSKLLQTESSLLSKIDYLIEEGILDWALQSNEPQLIMDLQSQLKGSIMNILLVPFLINEKPFGLFISFTENNKDEISKILNERIKLLAGLTAQRIKAIIDEKYIIKLESRLQDLNQRLIQSLPMTTFGEISLTVLKEATLPLQIIESNIDLIESGVGNLNRRLEIIKQQSKSISEIINLLSEISEDSYKSEPEIIKLSDLIEEIKSITSSQFKARGVSLDLDLEDNEFEILAIKTQFEYAIVQLLQFYLSADYDSDIVFLAVKLHNARTMMIVLKNENSVFDSDNYDSFIDEVKQIPKFERLISGLYSVKNIIKNMGGKIDCNSLAGTGTIFRIYLPLHNSKLIKI